VADKYEDLRTYVAVIDNGGINAAAAALDIAKSAVSRRLGQLEERLGATLIIRTTRSFEPTAAGRRY
jgi:DNA-binding transcriptional LysR family regulator